MLLSLITAKIRSTSLLVRQVRASFLVFPLRDLFKVVGTGEWVFIPSVSGSAYMGKGNKVDCRM